MDGAIVQVHDNLIVYRASGIGTYCFKQLVAARMEYEPLPTPMRMQETFDKGHETEDRVIKQLMTGDPRQWTIGWRQQEYDFKVTKNIVVRCHVDGVRLPMYRVLEVKSQGEAEWKPPNLDKSPFYDRYLWQFSAMMHATGWPLDVLVVRRKENEDGELDWYMVSYEEPPISAADMRSRVLRVEAAARKGDLPDECDVVLYPCPYYYLHGEIQKAETRLNCTTEDLVALAVGYDEARVEESNAKKRKEDLKKAIDQAVVGNTAEVEGIKITFSDSIRRYLNEDMLKADGIDPEKYKKETTIRSLRVTLPKG